MSTYNKEGKAQRDDSKNNTGSTKFNITFSKFKNNNISERGSPLSRTRTKNYIEIIDKSYDNPYSAFRDLNANKKTL